jgi:riboflavin kinase/FMN adenylyltransferase
MELVRNSHNLQQHHQECVVSIGNFDGVHIGHQAVIRQLRQFASRMGLPAVVMIFEPQPLEYFAPQTAPARLTGFRDKLIWLKQEAIDRVVCLKFQDSLARLSADEFIRRLLVEGLDVKHLVVGDDFRFGRGRTGDFSMLKESGKHYGFEVVATETLTVNGHRVSSSRIRDLLAAGEMDEAAVLLGRAYNISGRIVHGDKRGRELGFPTANILLKRNKTPLLGVYAVRVYGLDEEPLQGVVNIGTRPVFDGTRLLLEVHILDFNGDIYGSHIRVDFLKFLRREQKFTTVAELQAQVSRDIAAARSFFRG